MCQDCLEVSFKRKLEESIMEKKYFKNYNNIDVKVLPTLTHFKNVSNLLV